MPAGYRKLSAAALGVTLVMFGTALSTGASAVTPHAVRSPVVSFAQPAFAFETATYPVRFTTSPSGALAAGHGTITLTAGKGTILPLAIADVYDATTGTDLGSLSGGVLTGNGATGTWKVATAIPAGHVIYLRLD